MAENYETFDDGGSKDYLTGLLTIDSFRHEAKMVYDQAPDKLRRVAVLFIDVVGFREYNIEYGYELGDGLLVKIADFLRCSFENRLLARFYEDHFVALVYSNEVRPGLETVEKLFRESRMDRTVSLKIGIYEFDWRSENVMSACNKARVASSSIKQPSGIVSVVYDSEMNSKNDLKQYLLRDFDDAIAEHRICAFFQPVVRTLTGRICSFEALARWKNKNSEWMMPAAFFGVVEREHIVHRLDLAVIEDACRVFDSIKKRGLQTVPFSVNLSFLDFELCNIFDEIESIANKYDIPRGYLQIEIGESMLARDNRFIKEEPNRFHEAGYKLVLDDFGSRYSSILSLKDYTFDVIKIDMSFLHDFTPRSKTLLSSITGMAQSLGASVIAEGVETSEQSDFVYDIGCGMQQGYYHGRPFYNEDGTVFEEYIKDPGFEDREDRDIMDAVGRTGKCGYLLPSFTDEDPDSESTADNEMPSAILQDTGTDLTCLYMNRSMSKWIMPYGKAVKTDLDLRIATDEIFTARLRLIFDRLVRNGESDVEDISFFGSVWRTKVTRIFSSESRGVYNLEIMGSRGKAAASGGAEQDIGVTGLLNIYEEIAVVNVEDDTMDLIYYSPMHPEYAEYENGDSASESIRVMAEDMVAVPDRGRFLEYMDMDQAMNRLRESENSFLSESFRFKKGIARTEYEWMHVEMVDLSDEEGTRIMIGMSICNSSMAFTLNNYYAEHDIVTEYPESDTYTAPDTSYLLHMMQGFPLPFGVYEYRKKDDGDVVVIRNFANLSLCELLGKKWNELAEQVADISFRDSYRTWLEMAELAAVSGEEVKEVLYVESLGHWYHIVCSPLRKKNRFICTFNNWDKEVETQQGLAVKAEQRDRIAGLLKFVKDNRDYDYKMTRILEHTVEITGADRAYIMIYDDSYMRLKYEYCTDKADPMIGKNVDISLDYLRGSWEEIGDKDGIIDIPDTKDFKDNYPRDFKRFLLLNAHRLQIAILYENGKMFGYVAMVNYDPELIKMNRDILLDITYIISSEISYRNAMDKLNYFGSYDAMTGVRNRNSLIRAQEDLEVRKSSVGVISADLNGLKLINDTKGHEAGDRMIIKGAALLSKFFGRNNTYRSGGDEFVILYPEISEKAFREKFEQFLAAEKENDEVSVSAGCVWGENSAYVLRLVKQGDRAMYEAKRKHYEAGGVDRRRRR
ncbi:MAG: EAL domain-containing protein [Lachnospiraceae bacterium]|nr:EAL domain-containing protein [Lachnospiraceae bacterium]